MPYWGMHLAVAKKINQKLKMQENEFLLGNIMPDINNGYAIKDISKIIPHRRTHYATKKKFEKGRQIVPDYNKFYNQNKENMDNPLVAGYLTHLLVDYYWNHKVYIEKGIYDNNHKLKGIKSNSGKIIEGNYKEIGKIKANDYKKFTHYIYKKNLIDIPKYDEKFSTNSNIINTVKISKEDSKKVFKCLYAGGNSESKKEEQTNNTYMIFSQDELMKELDNCADFVVNYMEEKKKDSKKWLFKL